ncbi:hypothetical protein JB92DRAFT_3036055, partial [Gautieria morchelliformis]
MGITRSRKYTSHDSPIIGTPSKEGRAEEVIGPAMTAKSVQGRRSCVDGVAMVSGTNSEDRLPNRANGNGV